MTYEKFMEQVKEQILSFLPEEYANADVTIQEVSKNNNQKFHAICIKRPEDRIVPNVYLEDYYRTYEDDGNMENILTAIARIYQKNMENNENLLPFEVKDYESVKNRLYVVALNRNNNQDYLRDAVRRDITETDITSVVRVLCTNNQEKGMDCQHFFRQIFLGYFSDIVQAFDTLRKNVCGDDYTSLHNPIVLSSVLPAYGMFHSIQILFL